jgi:hypothetical protein
MKESCLMKTYVEMSQVMDDWCADGICLDCGC